MMTSSRTFVLALVAFFLQSASAQPWWRKLFATREESPVLTADEANAFVKEQFSHYFTDCEKFVETFGKQFQYCDFAANKPEADCLTTQEDLMQACLVTQGAPTIIYQLDPKPIFTGITSSYNEVAIKGFQKVFGVPVPDPATGEVTVMDMCFDLVIAENLQRAGEGVESTYWKGFFSVEICGIPGAPACTCDSMTPMVSYNMPGDAPTCSDCEKTE